MSDKNYILAKDFKAPKINLQPKEMETWMVFQKGAIVAGEEFNDDQNGLHLLIVDGQWAIPFEALETSNDGGEEQISDAAKTMGAEFKAEFDRIKSTNLVDHVIAKSKNSVNGIIVGGAAGLIFGAVTKRSILWSVVLGGLAGGLIGSAWKVDLKQMQQASEKNNEQKKPE